MAKRAVASRGRGDWGLTQGALRAHCPINAASDEWGGKPGLGSTPLFITTPSLCSGSIGYLTHSRSTLKLTALLTFPFLPQYIKPEEKAFKKPKSPGRVHPRKSTFTKQGRKPARNLHKHQARLPKEKNDSPWNIDRPPPSTHTPRERTHV